MKPNELPPPTPKDLHNESGSVVKFMFSKDRPTNFRRLPIEGGMRLMEVPIISMLTRFSMLPIESGICSRPLLIAASSAGIGIITIGVDKSQHELHKLAMFVIQRIHPAVKEL